MELSFLKKTVELSLTERKSFVDINEESITLCQTQRMSLEIFSLLKIYL